MPMGDQGSFLYHGHSKELILLVKTLISKLDYSQLLSSKHVVPQPELLQLFAILGDQLLDAYGLLDYRKFSLTFEPRKDFTKTVHGYKVVHSGGYCYVSSDMKKCTCRDFKVSVWRKRLKFLCLHQLVAMLVVENSKGDEYLNAGRCTVNSGAADEDSMKNAQPFQEEEDKLGRRSEEGFAAEAANASWPQALAYAKSENFAGSFGYADGISARDLAPPEVRHMVLEHFEKFPPADPRVHHMLGMLYLFLGLTSGIGNYFVLKIFTKYKQLRTPSNVLVINLAFCDFMLFIGLYPEMLFNCFAANGVWSFGEIACMIHAWFGTTFGLAQMITLSVIAYDRYHVIVKGMSGAPPSYKRSAQMLAYVWFFALGWGSAPFFGLGRFTLDGILSSCSYDYISNSATNLTFIIGAWWNGFFFPIVTIVYCYYFIVKAVFEHEKQLREQAKKMNVKTLRSNESGNISAEIKVAKIAMINISLWLFAWAPFAILTFMGQFNPSLITPLMGSLPVIIAKSSAVYNPIVYALSHPKYQECLRQELGGLFGAGKKESIAAVETVSTESGVTN